MSDVTLKVDGLEKLLKALGGRAPVARVGILGEKSVRGKSEKGEAGPTNAEIGAVHEFGSPTRGIPQRSFLRVPIADNLAKYMKDSGLSSKERLAQVIKEGSLRPWLEEVAVLAESIVIEAFDTGGFGKWAPWKTKGYENNTGQLLVDTQQLRNSITHEVA